ncbi:hypothetical protein BDF19DRAFT_414708 [Syncephalis fuscata]|nr:hypothetical protein BDF19DRAFT_414708 [Syncephalis fuscata]
MQGEFIITYLIALRCPVERLDDERVLVAKHVMGGFNESANEVNSEVLSLAVILTNCDNSNQSMDNQKPIWSHYIGTIDAMPIITFNAVAIIATEGLFVYSLADGAILSKISTDKSESILPNYIWHNLNNKYQIQNFVVCTSKDKCTKTIVDLIQPTNSKRLGIVDAELLATLSVESITANAFVMHSKDGYKIVDVSC